MTKQSEHIGDEERLVRAYNRMMERVKQALGEGQALSTGLAKAQETAVRQGELSDQEAERIGGYLKRDLQDAGQFLADTGEEDLRYWFHFDVQYIENQLWDLFTQVADQTKLQLFELEERARHADDYHTGEITTLGTLVCLDCGESMHFHKTGHIPPCPHCRGTLFRRAGAEQGSEAADQPGGNA